MSALTFDRGGGVPCDGCGEEIVDGARRLSGIESCCGGCYRSLCGACVEHGMTLLMSSKLLDGSDGPEPKGLLL